MAVFNAAMPIGSALGYVVGGAVEHAFGWRAAFYVTGAGPFLMVLVCIGLAPCKPPPPHSHLLDFAPVLRNRAALGKIAMNMFELRKLLGKNATMAYCFAPGGNGKVFSRGMLPWEIYEDPATGSAAGSLGAYLVRHGKLGAGHTLHVAQGVEMGRPSDIVVEVTQTGK